MSTATTKTEIFEQMNNLDLDDLNSIYKLRDFIIQLGGFGNIGLGGDMFYVDPVNGDDTKDGLSPGKAFKTLAVGYAALTTNKNDILFFIGGASSLNIPSGFEWAKDYAHLVGLASMLQAGGRCRLTHSADFSPIFPISADGCQFSNIHIQHGRGAAGNLVNTLLSGNRNSFVNVQLEGPLHVTEGGVAYRELVFANNTEGNSFYNCNIGQWSIGATEALGREIEFLGFSSDTYFKSCEIKCNHNAAGHELVEAGAGLGAPNSLCIFEDCDFIQIASGTTLTKAIEGPANGQILLKNCMAMNITLMSGDASVKEGGSVIAS